MIDIWAKMRKPFNPFVKWLSDKGVTPNQLTWTGFFLSFVPVYLYATGKFVIAAILLFIFSSFDFLDGQLARVSGKATRSGALLDSSLDKIEEGLLIGSFIYFYRHDFGTVLWLYALIISALMVSYVRARGEGLGLSEKAGPMNKGGRYASYILFSLFGPVVFAKAVPFLFALILITVVRRFLRLYNQLN